MFSGNNSCLNRLWTFLLFIGLTGLVLSTIFALVGFSTVSTFVSSLLYKLRGSECRLPWEFGASAVLIISSAWISGFWMRVFVLLVPSPAVPGDDRYVRLKFIPVFRTLVSSRCSGTSLIKEPSELIPSDYIVSRSPLRLRLLFLIKRGSSLSLTQFSTIVCKSSI